LTFNTIRTYIGHHLLSGGLQIFTTKQAAEKSKWTSRGLKRLLKKSCSGVIVEPTGPERCGPDLLVAQKWLRQIGPQYIGSSPRARAEWQLSKLLGARGSE